MAVEITLVPDKTRMVYTRIVDGKPTARARFDPNSANQQTATAGVLGIDVITLIGWVDEARNSGAAGKTFVPTPSVSSVPSTFTTRGMYEKAAVAGVEVPTSDPTVVLREHLHTVGNDTLLEWDRSDSLCCLDVDYHEGYVPDRHTLAGYVRTFMPRPYCWHFSKGGGLHLFYVAADGFNADELAAAACLKFRMVDQTGGVELKRVVRGPGHELITFDPTGVQDTGGLLARWFDREGTYSEQEVQDYLTNHEWTVGGRYPHDQCPINPSPDQGEKRNPVVVGDTGVTCFLCQGKGFTHGSRRAGFAPWATMLGSPGSSAVGTMVKRLCHWGHAKHVLEHRLGLTGRIAELAYRAALKAYHATTGKAVLIDSVFDPANDNLAWIGQTWYNTKDSSEMVNLEAIIATLPAVQYVDNKGIARSRPSEVCYMSKVGSDQTDRGYPTIDVVHGIKMAAPHNMETDPNRIVVARACPDVVAAGPKYQPRYLPGTKRMREAEAWSILNNLYPGLDQTLIKLLLCGVGCVQETHRGMEPRLFIAGPTGAGKTGHCSIAAAILGLKCQETTGSQDQDDWRRQVRQGLQFTPLITVNEVFKCSDPRFRNVPPVKCLDTLLTLTKDSVSHELYVGPVAMKKDCVLVYTEVELHAEVVDETQIARRLLYYRLAKAVNDWRLTACPAGVDQFYKLRIANVLFADACNTIVSCVIDEFFGEALLFDEMAKRLGVSRVMDHENLHDNTPTLQAFYKNVCLAPEVTDESTVKHYGKGFRRISKSDPADIPAQKDMKGLWDSLADSNNWLKSRRVSEKDWSRILNVPDTIQVDIRNDGVNVLVRFYTGSMRKPEKLNGEILDPEMVP